MADLGTVSSWVAAAVSIGAFAATAGRAWWYRPHVDWALSGEMNWPPDRGIPFLSGKGVLSNFGDGNAHRVTVHVQRGNKFNPAVLTTSPLLRPGESVSFDISCPVEMWESAVVWVTWTPPPIRRRRESTSSRFSIADHMEQSEVMKDKMSRRAADSDKQEATKTD